jgi:putative ABC transport system permease protein
MSLWRIAWKYLCGRLLANSLTALSVALGVSLILATVLLTRGIREGFMTGTTDYTLIVGAKSSPTQLVLGSIFRLDVATPNMLYSVYEQIGDDARVERAVPIALGDAYQGFRYVATTTAYFAPAPWRRRVFTLAAGHVWEDEPVEQPRYAALLGADVARRTGLRLGDAFYEGEEMAEHPLHVVGILQPTQSADDRTIFFPLATFWDMNEVARAMPVKPLTTVLIRPKKLSDLPHLHREFNVNPETQAAIPSAVLLTLLNIVGVVENVSRVVLGAIVLIVALSLFVALYSAMLTRRREIATMRALGARRLTILVLVLLEASVLALLGGVIGLIGGHGVAALGAQILAQQGGLVLPAHTMTLLHPLLLVVVVLLGAAAGLLPAVLAYRTEVAEHLLPLS